MSFKPMHDLESLTDAQREQHYLEACAHFELPPELRLLDFMWLDASDGKRNLVLYSKKGATDLIRDRRGISVVSTVPANGPGYVAFIVEGKNNEGRHEFAVGSASIIGLMGQNLANAVMIAHTRATRRMTLQFVGGLLDESEVQGPFTDINRAGGSLASLATLPAPAQPGIAPNSEPGKDITHSLSQNPPKEGVSLQSIAPLLSGRLATEMVAPVPFSGGSIIPEKVETLVQIEPAPKRKPGRKKSEISLDAPVLTNVEIEKRVEAIVEKVAEQAETVSPVIPLAESAAPAIDSDTPTKEQTAAWKAKLSPYTTQGGILNQGGLTENIFGKLRIYTMRLFPNAVVLPNKAIMLTNSQWEALLKTMEQTVVGSGPEGLVRAIEAAAK